ncbi:SH3 domain-containing protein [Phormidesmis priestleyi]
MMRNRIKLVIAASIVAILTTSCNAAEGTLFGRVFRGFFREASEVHPPPKVSKPILVPGFANPTTAQKFEKLIQDAGARASIKQVGKDTVLSAVAQGKQISDKSLRQEAYETILLETERYNHKAAKEQLHDLAEQVTDEIITELASSPQDPSQNGIDRQQQPQSATTNATIVSNEAGSKNIRSGPGTEYGVKFTAVPGDRVQILASGQDRGGFVWYKVYCPGSGADGWIAAQLIQAD